MLPNDPMLALQEAQATMARRQHEAEQTRLGNHPRSARVDGRARSRYQPAQMLIRLAQPFRTLRHRALRHHG
jgi:hypothetical protein